MINRWNPYSAMKSSLIGLCILIIVISASGGALNIDHSIPKGFYWKVNSIPEKSDYVLCSMKEVSPIGTQRKFGNGLDTIGKRIAGSQGDTVSVTTSGVAINGSVIQHSKPLVHDSQGRNMPIIDSTFVIKNNHYFLLGSDPRSFDSRYFGTVHGESIKSVIIPILTF